LSVVSWDPSLTFILHGFSLMAGNIHITGHPRLHGLLVILRNIFSLVLNLKNPNI